MVNAYLTWVSLPGLLLMAFWCPALVLSLRHIDVLMGRLQSFSALKGLSFSLCLMPDLGLCIALPLMGSILFLGMAIGSDPSIWTDLACAGFFY